MALTDYDLAILKSNEDDTELTVSGDIMEVANFMETEGYQPKPGGVFYTNALGQITVNLTPGGGGGGVEPVVAHIVNDSNTDSLVVYAVLTIGSEMATALNVPVNTTVASYSAPVPHDTSVNADVMKNSLLVGGYIVNGDFVTVSPTVVGDATVIDDGDTSYVYITGNCDLTFSDK